MYLQPEPVRATDTPRSTSSPARSASSAASDPLSRCAELMARASTSGFEYSPKSTRVDSPIDDALQRAARRVPGLRAHHDRARRASSASRAATSAAICSRTAGRRDRSPTARRTRGSKRCCPTSAGSGFDPTQQPHGRRTPHPRRGRARLCRRAADARRLTRGSARSRASSRSRSASDRASMRHRRTTPFVPWMSRDASAPLPEASGTDQ